MIAEKGLLLLYKDGRGKNGKKIYLIDTSR
jgi:hypothetical protein